MKIIKLNDIKTSKWSGGTTSELFIYPTNSNYKDLDFKFRLSRATIEVDESEFTLLPNVKRKLILLDGELELTHKNHHTKHLKPLQFDTFLGDWQTKSKGKATDLNLMMLGNTKGHFSVIKTNKTQIYHYKIVSDFIIFYVVNGSLKFNDFTIETGELLIIKKNQPNNFEFKVSAHTNIIVVRVDI